MTSDAKIGLLLGLVFIFIIAFVINGLPRFQKAKEKSNNELTMEMIKQQNDPITNTIRKVQEQIDRQSSTARQPAEESSSVLSLNPDNVRYEMELPGDMFTEQESYADSDGRVDSPSMNPFETVSPTTETQNNLFSSGQFTQVRSVSPAPITMEAPTPVANHTDVSVTSYSTEVRRTEPAKPETPKTYVVEDGDNLADIAKKIYGAVEGNKRATIMKIYEANHNLLKSPDEIVVGQKLILPVLKTAVENKSEGSLFSGSLLDKIKSLGGRENTSVPSPKPAIKSSGKEYVVKDGDSLWRIAASQLGNGSLYPEISKLNTDILKDEDNLVVGMRLKMPVQ
jgi:LysM repeat protein